jgi:tetratricopeptide (TPR) repeat protein
VKVGFLPWALLLAASVGAQTAPPPRAAPPAPDPKAIAGVIDKALQVASAEKAAGHFAEAERQLRSVAERFNSVRALLQLAELQSEQKNRTGALTSLRQARSLAPNSEDVLSAYAEALLASPTPDASIPILVALVRICPLVAHYQYFYGTALLQAGDAAAAVPALQEAARLEPDQAPTLIALGRALNQRKAYAEAKAPLLRGLSLLPESVEAVAALAEAEEGLGEVKDAEDHARRALAQSAGDPTANLVIAMVLMKQEKYAEARDALLKAAAADPASTKAHYQLSLVYARLDNPIDSQKYLALYNQRLEEGRERVRRVRRITGFSAGGMQP